MTNKTKTFSLLLAGTFLSSPVFAAEINTDYLNSLTSPKVTWSETEGDTGINISGKTFYYQYHNTDNYEQISTLISNNFTEENVNHKLFKDIASDSHMTAALQITNTNNILNIQSDFLNNGTNRYSSYGAITVGDWTEGSVGLNNIEGTFVGNQAQDNGAAISLTQGSVNNISGNFINNGVYKDIDNYWGTVYFGGAIGVNGTAQNISGNFIRNYVDISTKDITETAFGGGAIYNSGTIDTITGNFIGNYISLSGNTKYYGSHGGGAILNDGTIRNIVNSNFLNNYIISDAAMFGGAIWSASDILITADNGTSLFSGNKANTKSNAIYMSGANLKLSSVNNGVITFDDGIDGKVYNINLTGDGTGEIALNNLVENATALTIGNTTLRLGTKGNVNANNISGNGTIKVDVTFAENNKIQTGVINAADNLTGDYKVIANPVNDGNANYVGASSVFLTAPNDEATFDLARVIGSPYIWDIDKGNTDNGYSWSLELTDYEDNIPENPDKPDVEPSKPVVRPITPEAIAGMGLHEAAIEQTRSVVRNVRTKVADGRIYCPNCGIYDYAWNGNNVRNIWVNVQGETATIDKPVKMDADIWGVEAGFDVQNDVNNTLGVFASYRKGEYDLNGKADKIRSNVGSEIDINSYLAGLYYRYDKNMNWLFAAVYGGVQQADAKTDDGIAKFDTDGIEFGASIEAGHTFALSNDLTLDPSLGLYYTQINFDDAKDNVGKEYSWKDIKHLEAELGAKLEKQIDAAKVYVKPSVIQTVTSGDSVKITGLNKLSTYDDQTLGRIELGGRYGFTDALSAYGWVNYTFGSGYDATAFGAGINYAW